jgi:polyhydroxyalkanoate synthase
MVESYVVRAKAALRMVEESHLPPATKHKARFALTMLSDALAPSNIPWLNPAVVKEAIDTGGASLMRGMQNYLDDMEHHDGRPQQVDSSGFELGRNLAATPGRVVMRNELIELIAYEPQTPTVFAKPLLCSPPWINKYYIMDLAPGRSFVEWAVRNGRQVFMISYRNPDETMADFTMDDYLRLGPLAALDAIERITGAKQVDLAALCLGGTLAMVLLGYLAAHGQAKRIGTATFTNTMVDFSEPGDLGVFTDEMTIARLEASMRETGFLDAKKMESTFDFMRSNDLVWSYVVNNWFMGKKPPAFDILSWNADATRMPAKMHSQYLRSCYLHNLIVQPGAFTILDTPIDVTKVKTPLYILGAEGDHIAPWRSSFMTVKAVGSTEVTYTLTNAGHVAGIVNPPENAKAKHWTKARVAKTETADAWRASAELHDGSWWLDWTAWMDRHGTKRVKPYALPPGGDAAPGRYVRNQTAPPREVP